MRTIKFRAQRVDNGEWVYGNFVNMSEIVSNWYYIEFAKDGQRYRHLVNPETISQFTGLHDKTGKEIYEGHILKTYPIISSDKLGFDSFNVLVSWSINCWLANGIIGERQAMISEIIGDIHENADLLNSTK